MLVELRLLQWLDAGIVLYRENPLLVEHVFHDASQLGFPASRGPASLVDLTKRWLPNEYAGGQVRYGGTLFPIVSNTATALTVEGNPALVEDTENLGYQVIPPAAAQLTQLLQSQTLTVVTSFPQIPTQMPAISIRLERDAPAETYIGESLESYVLVPGVEVDANRATMSGSYLFSLWAVNRLEVLWLYAWLHNYVLRSMQMFSSWGLSDVTLSGSDLDPALQFLPERTYTRHLLLTATRDERAISVQDVEWIDRLWVQVCAQYAPFHLMIPQPSA